VQLCILEAMTYRARGRSLIEVILAVCFVAFLVGFISVLCVGNYFRAKRAQERQRQRRMAKFSAAQGQEFGAGSQSGTYIAPTQHMANGVPV
jgi:Tfp pilus assembly protein PilV